MRHILTAAAAIAVSGFLVSTAAVAQYQAGGPGQIGGQCKVVTDSDADAYGYMAPCAPSAAASGSATEAYAQAPAQSAPVIDGEVLGADPDPNVRLQMLRDGDMGGGAD